MPAAGTLILALDAATSLCSATLWQTAGVVGHALATVERAGTTGEAALLPVMVMELLAQAGVSIADLGMVAVNVGPGSFTGLRASIALAEGIALGAGLTVVPVTLAETLRAGLPAAPAQPVWCALDARQGRLFLHRDGAPADWTVADLADPPLPSAPVLLTGDAAPALGAALARAGLAATVTDVHQSRAALVAQAAALRAAGTLPPLATTPLYIDPPRALLPRGGLRPPPLGWSGPA